MPRRVIRWFDFTPMSHRPPLPAQWWWWCAVAFLAPSIVLRLVPPGDVPYRDLVWLLTLVPAYLLSLHYGMRGAVAGLLMGTVLFTSLQFLMAMQLEPEDWRITMPIYTAYGAIAISVGWLSQQLHEFYAKAIEAERIEVVSQVATAMRHEVNNALATILAECQLLEQDGRITHPEDHQSLQHVIDMARRIPDCMDRLLPLTPTPPVEYPPGVKAYDLAKPTARAQANTAVSTTS